MLATLLGTFRKPEPKPDNDERASPDTALQRLFLLALAGCVLIVGYAAFQRGKFFGVVSVGIMAGGASLLTGGLLGFLFGVPHTRDGERPDAGGKDGQKPAGQNNPPAPPRYRPNTSLEQVSDWLTKIIVGVSLVQFRAILSKLTGVATYLSKGLGGADGSEAFAATLLVYFAVSGFVFGFLWARLYLPKWFDDADDVARLNQKVSKLVEQQEADGKALALVIQQLSRGTYDQRAPDDAIAEAIKSASSPVKAQIFYHAQTASAERDNSEYNLRNETARAIFNGLIASDTEGLYHQNHAELSYAWRRKNPANLVEAEKAINQAIEIRDGLRATGWRFYEFHRARCRIEMDRNFLAKNLSDAATANAILADLRTARVDDAKWRKWRDSQELVLEWLKLNGIDGERLTAVGQIVQTGQVAQAGQGPVAPGRPDA
jgi:hypothetical protein